MTPAAKRRAVAHLVDQHQMSERRACKAIGYCRMTIRYETRRGDDHDLRDRMKALAHERRRFGYRRLHVLLRREGHLVNHKRLFRLSRGKAGRAQARRPQASDRHTSADADPDGSQ
ncbi:transposase InsO family protein [Rhizobium etli]|uniref:Transposase InsO family protein n=1 Tax=Rhizobium etli TaxID=29449 RepID=A0A7W6ZND7_RHIET|nr:transposase InsO family protein [Rhizobium etli]